MNAKCELKALGLCLPHCKLGPCGRSMRAPPTDEQDLLEELRRVEDGQREPAIEHIKDARLCIERLLNRLDKIKKLTL